MDNRWENKAPGTEFTCNFCASILCSSVLCLFLGNLQIKATIMAILFWYSHSQGSTMLTKGPQSSWAPSMSDGRLFDTGHMLWCRACHYIQCMSLASQQYLHRGPLVLQQASSFSTQCQMSAANVPTCTKLTRLHII